MPPERSTQGAGADAGTEAAFGVGERRQEIDLTPGDHLVIPETPLRPGWSRPRPAHLPHPTYWPAALALGVMLMAWGLPTTLGVSVMGIVLFTIALIGWIGEIRNDRE